LKNISHGIPFHAMLSDDSSVPPLFSLEVQSNVAVTGSKADENEKDADRNDDISDQRQDDNNNTATDMDSNVARAVMGNDRI
jgi:hypothetical protein